jgi:uncharacterized protein YjbI with pentapeptide repeats
MDVREELLRLLRRGDVAGFNEISRRSRQIVDLTETDLSGARLESVDLRGAILDGAKLARTRLPAADLQGASLRYANLEGADLEGADLSKANLYSTYLGDANLGGAVIYGADVASAVFPDDISAAEIRLALEVGTRLRHDPVVKLLRALAKGQGRRS